MKNELAADAEELLRTCSAGAMATHSVAQPDYPFVSVAPYAVLSDQRCVFLFSSLSTHSKNLRSNHRASLLVSQADGDLSQQRLTVIGDVTSLAEAEKEAAWKTYLSRHPKSAHLGGFHDFSLYELNAVAYYYVGGFGRMGWIKPNEF